MNGWKVGQLNRRGLLLMAAAAGATLATPRLLRAAAGKGAEPRFGGDLTAVRAAIETQRPQAIKRLQDWIALPSIAAEDRNMKEGCQMMIDLLKDAGFQSATMMPTDGQPGVFATLNAGARRTVGMYFMYDVKQFVPSEWSSPPLAAAIVDRAPFGKVMIGRGAINQKGPEATFLAALHALKAAGRKPPVNIVLVAEGEEEIGSPHFGQVVHRPEVLAALAKCHEVFMPFASQSPQGGVEIALGAKGVIEVELVASTQKWGRGAKDDIHSSYKAELDSAVWRMVKALSTLVSEDGNDPAIDGWFEHVKPLTARQKEIIADKVASHPRSRRQEAARRAALGARSILPRRAGTARLAADGEYRRHVCGLYRPRRQDGSAFQGHRQARFSVGARPDRRGGRGQAQGASRQTRLRRYRGQGHRRL